MNEFFLVYLMSVALNVKGVLVFLLIAGFLAWVAISGMSFIIWKDDRSEDAGKVFKAMIGRRLISTYLIFLFVCALIPSRGDLYFIIGGGVALKVAHNEEAQALPDNVLHAVNSWLKEVSSDEIIEAIKNE